MLKPRGVTVHYEVELGLVIGKTVRDMHPEDKEGALSAIESMRSPPCRPASMARLYRRAGPGGVRR